MSRSLASVGLVLGMLGGCAAAPPVQVIEKTTSQIIVHAPVQQWLGLQHDVAGMTAEEVDAQWVRVRKEEGADPLFYYGLLNQYSETHDAWVRARDVFRDLHTNEGLTAAQRQLAGILQEYNQFRINSYLRQSELLRSQTDVQQQLRESERDKLLLEQKIQALTDLEAVISTRKEQ